MSIPTSGLAVTSQARWVSPHGLLSLLKAEMFLGGTDTKVHLPQKVLGSGRPWWAVARGLCDTGAL